MDVPADAPDNSLQTPSRPKPRPMFLTTPQSVGSGVLASFEDDKESKSRGPYHKVHFKPYIEHDLRNNRVFMHAEEFIEVVFSPPVDSENEFSRSDVVTSIITHAAFQNALKTFLDSVGSPGREERLYPFIVSLYTAVLALLDEYDPLPDDHNRKAFKLAFSQNHPTKLVDAVIEGMSPDIRSIFDTFTVDEKKLSFHNVPHFVEVKDTDRTLCRGDNDFRVLHDKGGDPLQPHRRRKGKKASAPNSALASPVASDGANGGTAKLGKRARKDDDSEDSDSDSVLKVTRKSDDVFSDNRKAQDAKDADTQVSAQAQCARYAMEHLSNVILRSHSILTLFDRDRIQFEYFDRSVIAVSTAVDLSTEHGQKIFISMVYGLRRLSPEDLGLRNLVDGSLDLCTDNGAPTDSMEMDDEKTWRNMFYDVKMEIANEEYTLKEIVFRQPGLIGRTTCVVAAKRSSDNKHVVVKFSCPAKTRVSEMDLVQRARDCAKSDAKHAWVLEHLPNMIASIDVEIRPGSVQARMRDFLNGAKYADGETYHYEDRCLRICVSEKLFPITCLTSQREVAQVFLDILQTHKWLYDVAKIFHRDLSMSNIMFRQDKEGNVYGVPNDLDLASLLSQVEGESGNTSLRRTGTPPYMAFDLQDPNDSEVRHLYRHDLESLFYVLVMLVCRHDILDTDPLPTQQLREKPPFADWFDYGKSWAAIQALKIKFFHQTKTDVIKFLIAPGFKDFAPWVTSIRKALTKAFRKKQDAEDPDMPFSMDEELLEAVEAGLLEAPVEEAVVEVDEETLGGSFTYWTFYKYMRQFDGKPLDVRRRKVGFSAL